MKRFAIAMGVLLIVAAAFNARAETLDGTLAKINRNGVITLGYRESSPPFSSIEGNGEPRGFTIDLCRRIAAAVGERLGRPSLAVRYVALSAEDRFAKVADGSVDLECGNSTITLARRAEVDFSAMIFITGASFLVRSDAGIASLNELGDRAISVVGGTTTETALRERLTKAGVSARITAVPDHDQGLQALREGTVQAHAGDQLVLLGMIRKAADPASFAVTVEPFTYEPYGIALRRNDADFRLVVDATLARLYRTGEIAKIYETWFGDWGGRPTPLLIAMFALHGIPE